MGDVIEQAADLIAEIDRLRAENEAIKTAIGQQIGRNRQLVNQVSHARHKRRELRVERDALRQWQQEACEWMTKHIGLTHSLYEQKVDLLRRAGKEVQP